MRAVYNEVLSNKDSTARRSWGLGSSSGGIVVFREDLVAPLLASRTRSTQFLDEHSLDHMQIHHVIQSSTVELLHPVCREQRILKKSVPPPKNVIHMFFGRHASPILVRSPFVTKSPGTYSGGGGRYGSRFFGSSRRLLKDLFAKKFDSSPAVFLLCGHLCEGGAWSCRGVAAACLFRGAPPKLRSRRASEPSAVHWFVWVAKCRHSGGT